MGQLAFLPGVSGSWEGPGWESEGRQPLGAHAGQRGGGGPGQTLDGLVLCQDDWLWRRRCVAKTMFKTSRKMWGHFFSTGFRPSPPTPWVRVGPQGEGMRGRPLKRVCGPGLPLPCPSPFLRPFPPSLFSVSCVFPDHPGNGAQTHFTGGQPRPGRAGLILALQCESWTAAESVRPSATRKHRAPFSRSSENLKRKTTEHDPSSSLWSSGLWTAAETPVGS